MMKFAYNLSNMHFFSEGHEGSMLFASSLSHFLFDRTISFSSTIYTLMEIGFTNWPMTCQGGGFPLLTSICVSM